MPGPEKSRRMGTDSAAGPTWPRSDTAKKKSRAASLFASDAIVPGGMHFLHGGDFERADDAEAEPGGVCQIPDAFGELGVLLFPTGVGGAAGAAAKGVGIVIVVTAFSDVRVRGFGADPVVGDDSIDGFGGPGGVAILRVLIECPFADVAVDVVKTPGVGLLFADGGVLEVFGVVEEPGVILELGGVVAKVVGGFGSSAGGVFPFGFGGETVEVAGLSAEPLAEFVGGVLGHADGREAGAAHAEVHGLIRWGGLGDKVLGLVIRGPSFAGAVFVAAFVGEHEGFVFVPSNFVFAHPEGFDGDLDLRAFVGLAVGFAIRAANGGGASGDGEHGVGGPGFWDFGVVGFHFAGFFFLRGSDDEGVDFFGEFEGIRGVGDCRGFFFGFQGDVVRPDGTLFDPSFEHGDLVLFQGATAFDWGHEVIVIFRKVGGGEESAFGGVEGDNVGGVLTGFEGLLFGGEDPVALVFFGVVAGDAVLLENGLNVFFEADAGGLFEFDACGPVGTFFDPLFDDGDLGRIEQAFLFRGHHHVVIGGKNEGGVDGAF